MDGTHQEDLDVGGQAGGRQDRPGGLVWRAKDKDNYYIARFNTLEDNLRPDPGREPAGGPNWTTPTSRPGRRLAARRGSPCKAATSPGRLDGKKLLVAEDSTFPDAGRIGRLVEFDGESDFDDLKADENP